METQDNLNDLRVPSFSCYLNPIEGVVNVFDSGEKFSDMAVLDLHTVKPNLFTARSPSQAKPSGKRWFHAYARPCSTRKAVYVDQSIKHVDQFTFPVLNPAMDDLPRMSLQVFESGTVKKDDIARHLERKMSILTWDAIPKSKRSIICDDMADLFEIDRQYQEHMFYNTTSKIQTSAKKIPENPRYSTIKLGLWIFGWCNITMIGTDNIWDNLDFAASWGSCPKKRKILIAICYGSLWCIWKARNEKMFNNRVMSPIMELVFGWLKYRFKSGSCNWASWCICPF